MSREISPSSEVNENQEAERNDCDATSYSERENRLNNIEDSLDDKNTEVDTKKEIEENSPYSSEVNDHISSKEELDIYKKANLHEESYGDPPKTALVRSDVDMHDTVDHMGRDNSERIDKGLSPMTKDGDVVELHHIGQSKDSPLAELTQSEHRGVGNDAVLHNKNKETEIDRSEFKAERHEYWQDKVYFFDDCDEGDI